MLPSFFLTLGSGAANTRWCFHGTGFPSPPPLFTAAKKLVSSKVLLRENVSFRDRYMPTTIFPPLDKGDTVRWFFQAYGGHPGHVDLIIGGYAGPEAAVHLCNVDLLFWIHGTLPIKRNYNFSWKKDMKGFKRIKKKNEIIFWIKNIFWCWGEVQQNGHAWFGSRTHGLGFFFVCVSHS